ncbi:MAG: hypothetical protein IIX18_04625 [Clostridia bacterium]|nr:hypothetical protein [Clostridia bacterium]
MSWRNVKLILLVLLILVNALLGYLIFITYSETAYTDNITAKAAAGVLKKSGITVNAELLAVKNDIANDFSADYGREDYLLSVASFFLGDSPSVFLLPNGIRAENDLGEIALLGGDMSIDFTAESIDKNSLLVNTLANEEEASAARETLAALLGYPEDAFARLTVLKSGDVFLITVSQSENALPLSGFECTFGTQNGRIVYAEGKHCFAVFEESGEAPILNRANILLSEKSRGKTGVVKSITLCYTLYEDSKLEKLYLLPAYAVEYTDKSTSIISAKNGELFE